MSDPGEFLELDYDVMTASSCLKNNLDFIINVMILLPYYKIRNFDVMVFVAKGQG